MGAFLSSCLGYIPVIAVSFIMGILFFHNYQRMLLRRYMQQQRQLFQQLQQMQRRRRLARSNREEREE